jgi:hypothetical protein
MIYNVVVKEKKDRQVGRVEVLVGGGGRVFGCQSQARAVLVVGIEKETERNGVAERKKDNGWRWMGTGIAGEGFALCQARSAFAAVFDAEVPCPVELDA